MKDKSSLLIKPKNNSSIYQSITTKSANWKYLNFEAREFRINEKWHWEKGGDGTIDLANKVVELAEHKKN